MIRFVNALVLLSLICCCTRLHAQEPQGEPISNESRQKRESFEQGELELYKKLFVRRRKEHLEAIKGLQKIESYEKQYKMISILTEKIYSVIEANRKILEKAKFTPNNVLFPKDSDVKDAISGILENTALFGDIVWHLPNIMHRILKHQPMWHSIMKWSFSFVSQMRHLLDKPTFSLLHQAEQELQFVPRDPDFINPHLANPSEEASSKKAPKKEKRKKEPRITRIEL